MPYGSLIYWQSRTDNVGKCRTKARGEMNTAGIDW